MIERLAVALAALIVGAAAGALAKRPIPQRPVHAAPGVASGLTLFTAPFCAECEVMRERLRGLTGTVWQEISVVERPDLVRRLALRGAPTLLAVDRQGRVVDMIRGSCEPARIAEAFAATLG